MNTNRRWQQKYERAANIRQFMTLSHSWSQGDIYEQTLEY